MSFYAFSLLSPVVRVYWVLKHGSFPASRWASQGGVNFNHCEDEGRSFFVEVDVEDEQPVVLRSFVSMVPLEDYSHYIKLPEL